MTVIAKRLAQREDLTLQVLFRDNHPWPHTAQELVFGEQRSVGLQQDQEEIKGARPQIYWLAVGNQLPLSHQHAEAVEFKSCLSR